MFMSTRYSRRSSETSTKIFSVNDSLAKLCEFLTCEFSCSKLITCKYKDFRSSKIRFEQKTRLNNAIWRAWHIQYKQKKKARFLQFAAPFSDESSHSTSQAVILEGKYWKRRLDKVSREHKKWRRHLEDKLLRSGGLSKEQLEIEESESDTEEVDLQRSGPTKKDPPNKEPSKSLSHDSFETLCAMYEFPDTLFSSVEKQETQKNDQDLALFKDSSGMIQPTLLHLNPCFDELMENFDFLFTDLGTGNAYQSSVDTESPDLLLDPTHTVSYLKDDQFLSDLGAKKSIDTCSELGVPMLSDKSKSLEFQHESVMNVSMNTMTNNLQEVMFPQHHRGTLPTNQTSLRTPMSIKDSSLNTPEPEKPSTFEELPPQLQAPNLTARLQAAMSSRPKPISRNHSESNLLTLSKRTKKDNCPVVMKKSRIRRNTSNSSLPEFREDTVSKSELRKSLEGTSQQPVYYISSNANTPHTMPSILPKTTASLTTVPILPNYTNTVAPLSSLVPVQAIVGTSDTQRVSTAGVEMKSKQSSFCTYTPVTGLSDDFVNSIHATSHPVGTIAKIAPMPSTNQQPLLPPSQSTVLVHPNTHRGTSSKVVFNQTDSVVQINLQQPSVLPQSNDQQLLALAQLLQSAPTAQSAEATMCYLELLQQQLNMMMKQQQEQIQMKYQLQLQAEKLLQQQQQQNQLRQQTIVTDFKHNEASSDPLQFITTTSVNPIRTFVTQQRMLSTSVSTSTQPSLWATTNVTYASDKYQQSSSNNTTTPPVRVKDTPSVKPLKISDFMPASSPKIYNKSKSLVSKLHRMDDPQSSSEEIPFYDSITKLSQTTPPVTTGAFHPPTPTTLDSAMALVSLRHGTMATLSNEDSMGRISTTAEAEHQRFTNFETSNKFNEDIQIQEQRRKCHLSAEQKRRGLIKNAFEELGRILPGSKTDGKPTKLSNAAILEQTCEHILFLQQEHASCDLRMSQVQQEIDVVHSAISDCQNKLPATGVTIPRQDSANIKKNFIALCKEMIYTNSKSWIFCVIMRSLFDSFNKCVCTKTVDEFLNSIWHWLDRHCGLPVLRPVVLDTLTKLSTSTSVLDDPNCLNVLAASSLRNEDPTEIVNTGIKENSPPTSSSTFSSEWDRIHWRK